MWDINTNGMLSGNVLGTISFGRYCAVSFPPWFFLTVLWAWMAVSKELTCTWLSQSAGQRTDNHQEYSISVFQYFLFVEPQNFPVKVWVPKNTITNKLTVHSHPAQFYCREVQATQCTGITHRKSPVAFFYKRLAYFLIILRNY